MRRMRVVLQFVFFLSLAGLRAESAEVNNESIYRHLLQQYYTQLSTKDVKEVLGKSPFLVGSEITLKAASVKKEKEDKIPLRLPLTRLSLDESSFQRLSADSFGPETLNELLSLVAGIKLSITVGPEITEGVKGILKKHLLQDLKSNVFTEKNILIEVANPDWIQFRAAQEVVNSPATQGALQSAIAEDKQSLFLKIAVVVGLALLSLFVLFLALVTRRMSSEVGKRVETLVSAVKEHGESGGGLASGFSNVAAPPVEKTSAPSSFVKAEGENSFFGKIERTVLVAFAHDIAEDDFWDGAIRILLDELLNPEMSTLVEKDLEIAGLDVETRPEQSKKEEYIGIISSHLQNHASEYRRILRSPMGTVAAGLGHCDLEALTKTLSPMEITVLINSLAPLRKKKFIQAMPIEMRMEVATFGQTEILVSEMKEKELSLAKKLETLAAAKKGPKAEGRKVNLSYLTDSVLKAVDFAEDEAFYLKAIELGKEYSGFLNLLTENDEQFWVQVNLAELALASFGYSPEVLEKLKARLSGKRVQWYQNFVAKHQAQPPAFGSSEVGRVREGFIFKMKEKEKQAQSDSKAA